MCTLLHMAGPYDKKGHPLILGALSSLVCVSQFWLSITESKEIGLHAHCTARFDVAVIKEREKAEKGPSSTKAN